MGRIPVYIVKRSKKGVEEYVNMPFFFAKEEIRICMIIFVKNKKKKYCKDKQEPNKNVSLIGCEGNRAAGARCLCDENQMKTLTTNSW